ncbi:hypothetical protein MC885_004067, partial [Smutsia gigantea]
SAQVQCDSYEARELAAAAAAAAASASAQNAPRPRYIPGKVRAGAELHRDFLLVVHPEREKPRKQLAYSRIRCAQSTNKAQASSSPSPIPPCFSPLFHLPNARRRRAELQQQVQKVLKGVSCLSLCLTFLRPRPLGLLSLHPSHPPAPAQNVTEGEHPGGSAGEESEPGGTKGSFTRSAAVVW